MKKAAPNLAETVYRYCYQTLPPSVASNLGTSAHVSLLQLTQQAALPEIFQWIPNNTLKEFLGVVYRTQVYGMAGGYELCCLGLYYLIQNHPTIETGIFIDLQINEYYLVLNHSPDSSLLDPLGGDRGVEVINPRTKTHYFIDPLAFAQLNQFSPVPELSKMHLNTLGTLTDKQTLFSGFLQQIAADKSLITHAKSDLLKIASDAAPGELISLIQKLELCLLTLDQLKANVANYHYCTLFGRLEQLQLEMRQLARATKSWLTAQQTEIQKAKAKNIASSHEIRRALLGEELTQQVQQQQFNHSRLRSHQPFMTPSLTIHQKNILRKLLRRIKSEGVPVNAHGNHSPEFLQFIHENGYPPKSKRLNGVPIRRSIDNQKIRELAELLTSQTITYEEAIFNDPQTAYGSTVALSALDRNWISFEQCVTTFYRATLIQDYANHSIKAVKLLTPQQAFPEIVIETMQEFELFKLEELNKQLALEILKLPASERFMFLATSPSSSPSNSISAIFSAGFFRILSSLGARAYAKQLITPIPLIGKQTIEEVRAAAYSYARLINVNYPGADNAKSAHDNVFKNPSLVTWHDYAHTAITSSLTRALYDAVLYSVKLLSETTTFRWSIEIWQILDFVYYENYPQYIELSAMAHYFLLLQYLPVNNRKIHFFNPEPFGATPTADAALIILLNMVSDSKKWQEFGIDVEQFLQENFSLNIKADDQIYLNKVKKILKTAQDIYPAIQHLNIAGQALNLKNKLSRKSVLPNTGAGFFKEKRGKSSYIVVRSEPNLPKKL